MPGAEEPPRPANKAPKVLFGPREERRESATAVPPAPPRILFPAEPTPGAAGAPDHETGERPIVPFGSPQPPAPKSELPKVIGGGTIRRRIPCTAEDLRQLAPDATAAEIERARRIVDGLNLDDAHYDDVLRFGAELQAEHGAIAERELALANGPALRAGQATLTAMIRVLEILSPANLLGDQRSRLARALRVLVEPTRGPRELFEATYPELLGRARELRTLEPPLVSLGHELRGHQRRYAWLMEEIGGHLLAANFLVRYVREHPVEDGRQAHYLSQMDALETRATSLLATRLTLESGSTTNTVLHGSVRALIDAGRGMLEEDLPAFHTAYTAALLMVEQAASPAGDPGWFEAAREVHARVLSKLKGGEP